jgi:prepilin-type N-terminal cleavage/methylation domain-containing protein
MQWRRSFTHPRDGGFTLIEILLAVVILGVAFVAFLSAMQTGIKTGAESTDLTKAMLYAREMREWTRSLPFHDTDAADADKPVGPDSGTDGVPYVDDVDDLLGATFSPPRDSFGSEIADATGWSETVTLTWKSEVDPTFTVPDGESNLIHVEVTIMKNGETILTTNWLRAKEDMD